LGSPTAARVTVVLVRPRRPRASLTVDAGATDATPEASFLPRSQAQAPTGRALEVPETTGLHSAGACDAAASDMLALERDVNPRTPLEYGRYEVAPSPSVRLFAAVSADISPMGGIVLWEVDVEPQMALAL
jgi:hypothetical protein